MCNIIGVDNLAAGGGGNSACKTRLKAKAKVLVQLQSMQGRVLAIDKMLHGLQDVSDRCQKERIKVPSKMRNCSSSDAAAATNNGGETSSNIGCEQDAILNLLVDIETHIKIVRNSLLFLCRAYLLEKQVTILLSIQEQMYPTFDISVRFFGIDWAHIFRVSYNLMQCIDLMTETLVKGTSTTFTDVLLPRYAATAF